MIDWVLSFGGHVFFIIGILLRRAPTRRIEAGASISSRWHSRSVPRRRSIEWKEREPWKERAANIDISEALSICSEQFHRSTHICPFPLTLKLTHPYTASLLAVNRKDQKKVTKLEAQIPYHEGRGEKEEAEKIRQKIDAIWAKAKEAAFAM